MPSFDVVSEVDLHELTNSVDQASREVTNRFDFKGTDSTLERSDNVVVMESNSEFQLQQMLDILRNKMVKRGIDISCLEYGDIEIKGRRAQQRITARQGVEAELARKIVKLIKDHKLKVQAAIQGDQVRVSGKNRDDLQQVIALLRATDLGLPLQYINFRD